MAKQTLAFLFILSLVLTMALGAAQARSPLAIEYCYTKCTGNICSEWDVPCECPWGTITCGEYYCYGCAK